MGTGKIGPISGVLLCGIWWLLSLTGLGAGWHRRVLSCLPVARAGGYPLGLPVLGSLVPSGRKQERAKQVFLALKTHTYQ